MQGLNVSLITVVYNAESTISRCMKSVIRKNFNNVQYIIIDGGSTDQTVQIIEGYRDHISCFLSEPDKGVYDAINKGIKLATGDIVGVLNADDFFADETILSTVAYEFTQQDVDIIYGDLDYIKENEKIVRKWRSGEFIRRNFNFGWMPPHPTFYCKRNLFHEFGFYSLDYGTAADYELMLRFLYINSLSAFYIKKVMIKMKIGGKSNKSLGNRVKGLFFDLKAMQNSGILLPILALVLKPVRKIIQYF